MHEAADVVHQRVFRQEPTRAGRRLFSFAYGAGVVIRLEVETKHLRKMVRQTFASA